ncbi:MAG: hypothetical protein KDB88_01090 [Flavobacteriales bacterium]|nr:hypothetical protein [Flavobacteriales bacterium]
MTASRPVLAQDLRQWDFGPVHFSNDFPGGRANHVRNADGSRYEVLIEPEVTPINGSPWYAFALWADTAHTITVRLRYSEFHHRYHPLRKYRNTGWEPIPTTDLSYPDGPTHAHPGQTGDTIQLHPYVDVQLNLTSDTSWIAAQPVIASADEEDWWDGHLREHLNERGYGRAENGPKIRYYATPDADRSLFVIGRQHPPEVTGALALRAFAERLCANDSLANAFQAAWRVVFIPIVNPDGVDLGHWRCNPGGVDLNRDWWLAQQPETQAVRSIIEGQMRSQNLLVDLHSTWKDILYLTSKGEHNPVIQKWLALADERMERPVPRKVIEFFAPITSMQWAEEQGFSALVYEVGEDVPMSEVRKRAFIYAETLMISLLKDQ